MVERTLEKLHEDCDKACFILQKTHDGDDLDPHHLSLIQSAVNGWLTEEGYKIFDDLYKQVERGYVKPWFHDIEHMTQDTEGYIYWKGHQVEHYSFDNYKDEEAAALELAERCRIMEGIGRVPSCYNVVWVFEVIMENLPELQMA